MLRNRTAEENIRKGGVLILRGLADSLIFAAITGLLFWLAHSKGRADGLLELSITVACLGVVFGLLMLLRGIGKAVTGYLEIRRSRLEDDGDLTNGSWNA